MKSREVLLVMMFLVFVFLLSILLYFYKKTTLAKTNLYDDFIINFPDYAGNGESDFWKGFDGIYFSTWGGFINSWPIVVYGVEKIDDADKKSFEVLGIGYAKDSSKIYYEKNVIYGADLKTFQVMMDGDEKFIGENVMCYAKDINHVYLCGKEYANIDPQSFKPISRCVIADKNGVYSQCKKNRKNALEMTTETVKMEEINVETFKRIDHIFYEDNNHFYQEEIDNGKLYLKILSDEEAAKKMKEWHINYQKTSNS